MAANSNPMLTKYGPIRLMIHMKSVQKQFKQTDIAARAKSFVKLIFVQQILNQCGLNVD